MGKIREGSVRKRRIPMYFLVESRIRRYGRVHAQNNEYSRIRIIYEVFLQSIKVEA